MRNRNSRSQANIITGLDHSQSSKMFYVNDEVTNSKDITTIFHSPYKDGRRNKNYTNPTFLSSNLFYPEEQIKKQLTPRHNLIYNRNQKSRKQLYDKRMQKADNSTLAVHQAAAHEISQRKQNMKANDQNQIMTRSRSRLRPDKNQQLVKELEILLKYRELDEKKERASRVYTEAGRQAMEPLTPIYIQKNRMETEEKAMMENKKNLKEWIAISDKIKTIKNTASFEGRKAETLAMDNYIMNHAQRKYQKEIESRRNAGVLANILREQIKQAQARKEKEKRERVSFQ